MKKLDICADETGFTLSKEAKERFSTTQRFVITLVAIIGATIILTVREVGAYGLLFFIIVAIMAPFIIVAAAGQGERIPSNEENKD